MKLNELIDKITQDFPEELAESWDQVGIHFGSGSNSIKKVLVALDMRPEVVEEAIDKEVDTLILHHPPIFKKIQRFNTDDPQINMYAQVIRAGINVYAMHTNYDIAEGGMNDLLAGQLDLRNVRSLSPEASFETPGLGRVGELPRALAREDLIQHLKEKLQLEHLITIEKNPKAQYQTVAIIGGSGSSLMGKVVHQDVDVFITGDITYHTAHDLYEYDLLTVDAGHYIEHVFIEEMTRYLKALNLPLDIHASTTSTNPFVIE